MLGQHLERLLSISSEPLSSGKVEIPGGVLGRELGELLARRNGFVALESALVVRGAGPGAGDLAAWNSAEAWRQGYDGMADGIYFFAEDVFGGQFGLSPEGVVAFDPETGDRRTLAPTLDAWAGQILADVNVMTGYPLAYAWQRRFGVLGPGKRLVPKIPFVLGGDFAVDNLYELDDLTGMRLRADLAVQLRDLPDGAQVNYRVVD